MEDTQKKIWVIKNLEALVKAAKLTPPHPEANEQLFKKYKLLKSLFITSAKDASFVF